MNESEIFDIIRECCGEVMADTELIGSGLLDSYAFIQLLACFEEKGIRIEPTEVGMNEFSTPGKIAAVVRKYSKD